MPRKNYQRLFYVAIAILILIFSLELLKSSAGAVAPDLEELLVFVDNSRGALGFGWLMSYVVMSGYPVTVLSISFLDAGVFNELFTFLMINGSRLGASLIVILIGVVSSLKGGEKDIVEGSSIGFLTLIVTYSIQIPAIFLGLVLLQWSAIDFTPNLGFLVVLSNLYDPMVSPILNYIGPLVGVPLSLAILYFSLTVFEKAFKGVQIESFKSSWINFLMEKTHYSFLLGAAITLLSQTVALSIGIVVPLYMKGFVQRKNLVPYIMGACITTFGGTLAAAFILRSQVGINISLIVILSTFLISGFFLIVYRYYHKAILATTNFFLKKNERLVFLAFLMFIVPFLLLLF